VFVQTFSFLLSYIHIASSCASASELNSSFFSILHFSLLLIWIMFSTHSLAYFMPSYFHSSLMLDKNRFSNCSLGRFEALWSLIPIRLVYTTYQMDEKKGRKQKNEKKNEAPCRHRVNETRNKNKNWEFMLSSHSHLTSDF
jgi:hypothetical protein